MPRRLAFERLRVRGSNVQEFRFLPMIPIDAPFGSCPFMGYVSELVDRLPARQEAAEQSVKPAKPELKEEHFQDSEEFALAKRIDADPVYGPIFRRFLKVILEKNEAEARKSRSTAGES